MKEIIPREILIIKTGYIEFAMGGNYSTISIVQMCSHLAVADSEPQLPWQPPGEQ